MRKSTTINKVKQKYTALKNLLDERTMRIWAGTEALSIGIGGIAAVCAATGMSRTRIREGIREAAQPQSHEPTLRIRRSGGGRKKLIEKEETLLQELERLVDPTTRGDPQSPLRWTTKSLRHLAEGMRAKGYPISYRTIGRLLKEANYQLQSNRKTLEGNQHPDRDAQFQYISERVAAFQQLGQPVISVDTKKKELIGNYKNQGQQWLPKGQATKVLGHDFIDPEKGKVIPYGVYDLQANQGWVNVGIDHDTPAFAVQSIRQWWFKMGRKMYPEAQSLLITADAGGSNGYRSRLWKVELQHLADEIEVEIHVCHFPPGTSKWNKIEHRMFCHITENWKGEPLIDHETVIQLIGNTKTRTGLKVKARLDKKRYPIGIKIPDTVLNNIALVKGDFHGDWNYAINPQM